MKPRFIPRASLLASSVAAVLASNMVAVQQSSAALEEVLVTATKRAVNLQDIPMSVTAVSGERLTELGVYSIPDMEKTTPGLKIRVVGNTPSIIIRGAGSAGTTDTAVPVYNDGLYRPRTAQGLASFVDVERVEVLRGPQGTLFGRNTLGGLVNVITAKPNTQKLEYGGALTLGDYELRKFEGFVNIPLGDKVALRVSGTDTARDPYVENTFNSDGGLKDADDTYLRGQLNFDISETMNLNLTAGYWRDTANGAGDFGHKVIGIPVNPETRQTNGLTGVLDIRQGLRDGWGGGKDSTGNISNGDISAQISADVREIAFDYLPNRDIEEDSFSALFKWDLGFAELKTHIGYADFESINLTDGEFSIVGSYRTDTLGAGNVSGEWGLSESLQADINLTSTGSGPLQWTVGYFYFDEETTYAFLFGDTVIGSPQTEVWAHWVHGTESSAESQAIYGQAEYDITEKLTVTAGLRYSEDERTSERIYTNNDTLTDAFPTFQTEPSIHWEVATKNEGDDDTVDYRLAAQYNITEDVMVFASAATGYISGGTQEITGDLLDPTEVDSYELGVRSILLDGAMTLNATLYQADYKGLTTSLLTLNSDGIAISQTVPGGEMNSQGLEVEMNWQPIDNLSVVSGLAFDFSEFGEFRKRNAYAEDNGLADAEGFFDLDGEDTPFSPDLTANLGISYDVDLGSSGRIVPSIFLYYSDEYSTESVGYFWAKQDSYTTVDLTATWYSRDEKISVQAFVNNATEEDVITGSDTFSGNRAVVDYNNPRTWGVRMAYNF
ncbi:TonB-dependent receptor [Kineobactrum sediminis]|uniref:TonB-dependent receptor n=1 Tax=Kineobactrum sediminis TaxID=1905677 RepID=A0A2N5XZ47_9GAMM|nr:TonB-dependent receptor [Kineobactrum sediminis]PLW81421.1 TonB-dependent receptor [Kineobactrum sediminis]